MTCLCWIFGCARFRALLVMSAALCITFIAPQTGAAQDTTFVEYEAWTDLATIYNFSPQFRYDGDYGWRGFFKTGIWQLYVRPSVRHRPLRWLTLHGGMAWFHTFYSGGSDLDELRPWLGARAASSPVGFTFSFYFRAELRAFYLTTGNDTAFSRVRTRYQFLARSPDFRLGNAEGFYALGSIEFFKNLDVSFEDLFIDRVRINLGMGKRFLGGLRTELSYLRHTSRLSEAYGFAIAEHIVRLRFFYNIN